MALKSSALHHPNPSPPPPSPPALALPSAGQTCSKCCRLTQGPRAKEGEGGETCCGKCGQEFYKVHHAMAATGPKHFSSAAPKRFSISNTRERENYISSPSCWQPVKTIYTPHYPTPVQLPHGAFHYEAFCATKGLLTTSRKLRVPTWSVH